MHADRFERELDHQLGAFLEDRRCPRTPTRCAKPHSAVPNPGSSSRSWKIPIAVSVLVERHREAGIRPGRALPQRPGDEPLEAFDRASAAAR